MNKKLILLPVLGIALTSAVALGALSHGVFATQPERYTYTVDFFNNYLREDFELSNGTKGKGNNLLYLSIEAKEYDHLEKPTDPVRERYEFQGWYLEEKCVTEWDFANDTVHGNLRLFAKWGIAQAEEGQEPAYNPPSTVLEESASTDYVINSVMNFKVNDGLLKVPTAALSRLAASASNVLPLMEYKVKAGKTITATYASNYITVTCGSNTESIQVKDDSGNLIVDNTNYEAKAKKYEAKIEEENENYHVMLAGSSSIEFWTSSKQDLSPIVSYNHGIGGTTIEEWDEKLNQRLVFPYKPKMVVYYVGINNVINSKQDATTIWNHLEKFFNDTHAAMPDTKVQYILMNLIPGYKDYFTTINAVNAKVVEYQASNPWLTLINPGTALLKENGEPNAAYFRTDGLHLSYYGYVVWGGIIKESIIKGLENN
jgi:uncharacterized repeat protein (TIGR02543 family)